MKQDSSILSFKCPTCGAPLEPEAGKSTMKCPYCGDSVVIPKAVRLPAESSAHASSARSSDFETSHAASPVMRETTPTFRESRNPGINIRGIIAVVCLIAVGAFAFAACGASAISSMLFAHQAMSFGSKGISQGMFQDARAIAVDGSGKIVVADYEDGRVQVFGPDGKSISLFNITGATPNHYIRGLAVSHDGKIYIASLVILIYDENGQLLGRMGTVGSDYGDVALGADGTLYALAGEDIYRFKSDGTIDLKIEKAVSNISGQSDGVPHLAVDGLGNMYLVDDKAEAVFKYSPEGKFVNQFGGKVDLGGSCRNCSTFQPGKFWSPNGIAVDGYGRIFVADFDATQVFDSTGKYLNHLSGGFYGIALDTQSNLYATSFTDHNVVKYQIQKP